MATNDVDISDLPVPGGSSTDISDLPTPPPPAAPQQSPGILSGLRALDAKYLGGAGRQALLAARAIPDAANSLVNIIPNGLQATYNLATGARHPMPSDVVSGWMDKLLPHPENTTEKVTHLGESLLAGAGMPIPGGYGRVSPGQLAEAVVPQQTSGADLARLMNKGVSNTAQFGREISFNPAGAPGGMNRGDVQKALGILQKRLNSDNTSFPGASATVAAANEQGIPLRLTEAGPNTQMTGQVLAQRPGASQHIIRSDREATQADTTERVAERVRDDLNAQGDAGLYADVLRKSRGANARANYQAVRNDPQPIMDGDIWHILENPDVARIYQNARNMDARVRSLDATNGRTTPPLADLYAPATSIMPRVGAQGEHLLPPPEGEPQWVRTGTAPSVRDLDFLQRAMETKIGQLYNQARSGQGAQGGEGDLATALKSARASLVDKMKELSPSFKQASETYGSDSEVMDAYAMGRGQGLRPGEQGFLKMTPGQAQQAMNGMSDSAKTALRMGVAEQLLASAEMSGRNVDLARQVVGGGRKQEILQTLFDGDQTKFNAFRQALQMESRLHRNNSQLLGGSQTFARQEAAQDFEHEMIPGPMGQAADLAAQGLLHRSGVFIHGVFHLMQSRMWSPSVAAATSRILSSPDPQQAAEALQTMENQLAQAPRYQSAALKTTKAVAAGQQPNRQQLEQRYGVQP